MKSIDSSSWPVGYRDPKERDLFKMFLDWARSDREAPTQEYEPAEKYLPVNEEAEMAAFRFQPPVPTEERSDHFAWMTAYRYGTSFYEPYRLAVLRIHFRNWLLVEKRFPGRAQGKLFIDPASPGSRWYERFHFEYYNRVVPISDQWLDERIVAADGGDPAAQQRLNRMLKRHGTFSQRIEIWLDWFLDKRLRVISHYNYFGEMDLKRSIRDLMMVEGQAQGDHPVENGLIQSTAMVNLQQIFWAARVYSVDPDSLFYPTAVQNAEVMRRYVVDFRQILADYRRFISGQ